MKKFIEKIIQKRNPAFRFDESIGLRLLLLFLWQQGISLLRGCKVCLYGRAPRGMLRGRHVRFFNSTAIRWGRFAKIGDYVLLSAIGKHGIQLGNNVSIGAFSHLVTGTTLNQLGSHIVIGNNVGIGEFAYLGGAGGLTIGDDCIIGQYFSCHPENHHFDEPGRLIRLQGVTRKGIVIGNNCWIGSKVTILDGVEVGEHCVLAAGTVVTRSVPPHSVVAGVPARVIKNIAGVAAPSPVKPACL